MLQNLLAQTGQAFWAALTDLIWPTLIFGAVAFIARGADSFRNARKAAPQVRINLLLLAFDLAFIAPALLVALTYVGGLIEHGGVRLVSPQRWAALPDWAVLFAALFAGDFIGYWRHRFEHIALLWPAHAIHHSDDAMTWTTGIRFHPINRFTTALIDTSFLALLGLPLWALMANNLVRHFYGLFIHMDLPWTYGPFGRVFVSPAMHRWHHVRDARGAGVNFATIFSVFDQLFRTHSTPGPCTVPLGVREDIGPGVLGQLAWPFQEAWRAIHRRTGARETAPAIAPQRLR